MILTLVLAMAGPFFIRGPDGRPLMRVDDVRADVARHSKTMKERWNAATARFGRSSGGAGGDPVVIYRWQDADGQWHYASQAPADGVGEKILVDPDVNVVESIPVRSTLKETSGHGGSPDTPSAALPLSVSPQQLETLIDEARKTRDAAEQRTSEMQRSSGPDRQ